MQAGPRVPVSREVVGLAQHGLGAGGNVGNLGLITHRAPCCSTSSELGEGYW